MAVVVYISSITTHGWERDVPEILLHAFPESAILLIDIKVILLVIVITDVNVGPVVAIEICNCNTQSKIEGTVKNSSSWGNLGKALAVVTKQFLTIPCIPTISEWNEFLTEQGIFVHRVIQWKQVQVPVLIVIQKGTVCGISMICNAILFSPLGEGKVSVIHEQEVLSESLPLICWICHVNIQETISVYIGHDNPVAPGFHRRDTGFLRNILKAEIPLIQIKAVTYKVSSKEEVNQIVIIDVTCCYPGTIEHVIVPHGIKIGEFFDGIPEIYSCPFVGEQCELFLFTLAWY